MNPTRYRQEISSEQQKYPGKYIYHLSSTHSTANCNIKKECDRILASKRSESGDASISSSSVTGQLRHLIDDSLEDAVESEPRDEIEPCNDTNESDLLYFARVSNHYLRLI